MQPWTNLLRHPQLSIFITRFPVYAACDDITPSKIERRGDLIDGNLRDWMD